MSTEDYNSLCSKIYQEIKSKLHRKENDSLRFAIRGTAEAVLRDRYLARFLRSLVPPSTTSSSPWPRLTEAIFIERVRVRGLYDFLAALIFAGCNIDEARMFVASLVVPEEWTEREQALSKLPASHEALRMVFGGDDYTADKFFSKQGCFCAVVLRKGQEVRVTDPLIQRLPIIEESPIGSGSFGHVSRVVIAPGHFWDPDGVKAGGFEYSTREVTMARKDYITSPDFPRAGKKEHEILKSILESLPSNSKSSRHNIVDNWGSLSIAPDTYSLFMPKAEYDLQDYMMNIHPLRPTNNDAKASVIECAMGLAAGLSFLHTGMRTVGHDHMVCYHMDLKPDNVLIFDEGGTAVWRLSDFNMSSVRVRESKPGGGVTEDNNRDINRWFIPRYKRKTQTADPSLSATINRRGEGTYLAPESVSQVPSMTEKSDVWSLACVLSVVFAYLEEGSVGVDSYSTARQEHRNADDYDRFFIRGKFSQSRLSPIVNRWHGHLIKQAGYRDTGEAQALKQLFDGLEREALEVNKSRRCDAAAIEEMLKAAWKAYTSLQEGDRPSTDPVNASGPDTTPQEAASLAVDQWSISSAENYKGCDISSDGTLVAYWTDRKIALYTAESLKQKTIEPVSTYPADGQDHQSSIWKSVSLSQRYLIASAISSGFHCHIFDLTRGQTEDSSLNKRHEIVLSGMAEIQKLAISPNGRTMACVLRDNTDIKAPGSLFYADVKELIKAPKAPGSTRKPLVKLDWPGPDVSSLSISDARDIHIVVRPELTARSRGQKTPIIHVSLEHSTIKTLNVESIGFDSSSTVSFFTSFLPFQKAITDSAGSITSVPEAVLVTRENRLHIQTFPGPYAVRDEQHDIKSYRIIKLLAAREDRMYALGVSSLSKRMLLLEIDVSRQADGRKTRILISKVQQLPGLSYGDEFVARFAGNEPGGGGEGEGHVLIASLVAASGRRAVFRASLPGNGDSK